MATTYSLLRRQIILQACSIWLSTRVIYVLITYMVVALSNSNQPTHSLDPGVLLDTWRHWDTGFFLAIAQFGYYSPIVTVYYPVYPLLVHLTAAVLGGTNSLLLAAILVSNLSSLVACIGVGLLVLQLGGTEQRARNAILVMLSYPLSFFLAAPYTESTFLAFAVWTLVFMYRKAWYRAAMCAFLAGFTRPTAVILILPLIWEYGRQREWWLFLNRHWRVWQWKPQAYHQGMYQLWKNPQNITVLVQTLVVVEAVPYALALYALYCNWRFGSPWVFIQSELLYWFHRPMFPWESIKSIIAAYAALPPWSYSQVRFLLDALPLMFFSSLTAISIRRIPLAFTLYMICLLALCIDSPIINGSFPYLLMSVGRFLTVSIPLFILLGRWIERHIWLYIIVIGGGFALQVVLTVFYLKGAWIV